MQIATVLNTVNRNVFVHQQQVRRGVQTIANELRVSVGAREVAIPFWNSHALTFTRLSADFILVDEEKEHGHRYRGIDLRTRNGINTLCSFKGESPDEVFDIATRVELLREKVPGWMVHSYSKNPFALIESEEGCVFFNNGETIPVDLRMSLNGTPNSPVDIAFKSGGDSYEVTAFPRLRPHHGSPSYWRVNGVQDSLANEIL